ncbi:MAG: branched-chain amino acid transport system substrate-binding protein [Solirubrobacteraceae bacterium]|nr:branched-chain amino acid transport system substrate-binding protein [Solirubrobacteraceae bacterium]
MTTKTGILTGLTCAAAVGACSLPAQAASPSPYQPLTIYSSLPLRRESKPQSQDIVRAFRMALKDHGATAGGHRIRYRSLDDATAKTGFPDPKQAARNARTAARDSQTIAYIGEFNSFVSVASIPILNRAGILQVSPSNTAVGLTRSAGAGPGEPGKYYPTGRRTYGRVVPSEHREAAALVSWMKDEHCKNAYVANDTETYGAGMAHAVARAARRRHIKILANRGMVPEPKPAQVHALARRVRAAGAECFLFGGFTQDDAPAVFTAVGARSPHIKLFGPDGLAELAFTEALPAKLQRRVYITNPTLAPTAYPARGRRFFRDFKATYHHRPEPYAIYGYEAMSVVLDSIDRAEAAGRRAVVDAFFRTKGRRSVLGTYDIDRHGDTTLLDYGGFRIRHDRLVFARVIRH